MFQLICILSLIIFVLFVLISAVYVNTHTLKANAVSKWILVFFLVVFLLGNISMKKIEADDRILIEADDIVGTIEGASSSLLIYLDPSTGAPDYALSDGKQHHSLEQVVFDSEVNRYAFKIIESSEKEYYILISGVAIESVVGEVGDVTVEDNLGTQFSVVKKSEQINGEHTLTRIIAFASLSCWDEKSYRLTVTDNFGVHEN